MKFDLPRKSNDKSSYAYKDLNELKERIKLLKINHWTYEINDQNVHLKYMYFRKDGKRNLWNDGESILWYLFIKINDDLNNPDLR